MRGAFSAWLISSRGKVIREATWCSVSAVQVTSCVYMIWNVYFERVVSATHVSKQNSKTKKINHRKGKSWDRLKLINGGENQFRFQQTLVIGGVFGKKQAEASGNWLLTGLISLIARSMFRRTDRIAPTKYRSFKLEFAKNDYTTVI